MLENIKSQENNIITTISDLKSNKNPFSVFFILADLKDVFISIGETLLNGIEVNYSKNARKQYLDIVDSYKKAGIFESIYNYYLHNDLILKFKTQINKYFENSFFIDISFFYFTLSRENKYKILFDFLNIFYVNLDIKNKYFVLNTYLEKKTFLQTISKDFANLKYDKDVFFIIKFLNTFLDFDFSQIKCISKNNKYRSIKLIKNITLFVLKNNKKYENIYNLLLESFVFNKELYENIVTTFEENKLFEIIEFLRNDLISGVKYEIHLDFDTKVYIKYVLHFSKNFDFKDFDEKINFLLEKENKFASFGKQKGNFARITFKRYFLENNFSDIIDLTLGITALPQDVFYFVKQKNLTLNLDELKLYNEIKDLILYIDKSYFLNLLRPFLLTKIAHYFNNSDQKYYIIKFILCIILPTSYSEYKKIYKFFYNLEAFYEEKTISYISRAFQFGWIILIFILVLFIAPFGVLCAFFLLFLRKIMIQFISKLNPRIKLSLNFQIGTFASFLAILSIILGSTIGYKDNINFTYNNFKGVLNAFILPTGESIKMILGELNSIQANVNGVDFEFINKIKFSDIDYLNGEGLYDIKNKK